MTPSTNIKWVKCRDVRVNHPDGPHEDCHYLNSEVRRQYGGTGKINAAYVGHGYAAIFMEPRSVKLSHVAQRVPPLLRGDAYSLYLVQQRQYWNNEPLYILDEWSAYMSRDRLRVYRDTDESFNLYKTAQFMVYAYVLYDTIEALEPEYEELEELGEFIRYMARWTHHYIEKGDGERAKRYLRSLK